MYNHLFSEFSIKGRTLKNRLTMAPLYLGYAGQGGTVSDMLLEHYRLMAQSGVSMVVVENSTVDYTNGSGSTRTIRADTEENLDGLKKLAEIIKNEGALACLQINHAGRFASASREPLAPSAVDTFGRLPKALDKEGIRDIVERYARAALLSKKAGFDMVELHGGTGYLLAAFLSPHTNKRTDEYGGPLENRARFALEVLSKVKDSVDDYPVGYRFLADEWLPDGLHLDESEQFAQRLDEAGIAYISVMGGTYESFFLPEILERSKKEGYMLDLATAIKAKVKVPVISAGRFATGGFADKAIADGKTDLIGLARVLWADPEWPKKVMEGREGDIIECNPECGDSCTQMVTKGRAAFCVNWSPEKIKEWKAKFV
jgi:2,4-dienoyl-CoA reductase (NADPH2)